MELGSKRTFTEEEAFARREVRRQTQEEGEKPSNPERGAPPAGELITNDADEIFFPELATQLPMVNGEYRTSVIIDPPNGRIAFRDGFKDIYAQWLAAGFGAFDGPEIRPANERCLNSSGQVPLVMQIDPEDSKTIQILQTEDYVILNAEYSISLRIIPLNRKEHPISWRQWRGTSVGRWEGNKLVINTKNFRPEQSRSQIRTSAKLELTEVFSLTADNELLYRFTFSDEDALEQPFTGEISLSRMADGQRIYESACHEGNYALPGILAGARRIEADGN